MFKSYEIKAYNFKDDVINTYVHKAFSRMIFFFTLHSEITTLISYIPIHPYLNGK